MRNTIDWQPTWGGQQSAELTLQTRRGNAMDISTMLIALLRAANREPRTANRTAAPTVEAASIPSVQGQRTPLNASDISGIRYQVKTKSRTASSRSTNPLRRCHMKANGC